MTSPGRTRTRARAALRGLKRGKAMPPASSSCSGFRESEAPSPPSAADLRGSANHEVCPRERPSRPSRPAGAEEPKPALGAGPRGAQLAGAPRPCRPLLRGRQLARRLRRQLHSRVTARAWVGFVRRGRSVFLSATILHHVARVYPSPFVHARHLRGLLRDKWEVCFVFSSRLGFLLQTTMKFSIFVPRPATHRADILQNPGVGSYPSDFKGKMRKPGAGRRACGLQPRQRHLAGLCPPRC